MHGFLHFRIMHVLHLFVFKLQNNPTVTNGHLWMCLGVMAIGLLGIIRASKWKIAVNGNQMEIQRLFRKSIVLQISEIERVEIGEKEPTTFIRQR